MKPSLLNWTYRSIDSVQGMFDSPVDMRKKISRIKSLPPMPGMTAKLMQLAADPLSDGNKLAEIIEMDPLLATQVIRWANSAYFGYKGKINSVRDAINRVLGYQVVFDLALGLTALKPLKAPVDGVVGIRQFWRHALASTHLTQAINKKIVQDFKVEPGLLFTVALIHNIGFPLLGSQFPDEFNMLENLIAANPDIAIVRLERFAFDLDHSELGSWLLRTWSMPKAIVDVVYHHHNPEYRGEHFQANLQVYLNDCLLAILGYGDGEKWDSYLEIVEMLGLSLADCDLLMEEFVTKEEDINSLVEICLGQ